MGKILSNSISDLSTFDFYFSFSGTIDRSLPSFCTRFWLEEKQWLCDVSPVHEALLPTDVEYIFSRLFPAIEHISVRSDDSHLCNQFNRYSFPGKHYQLFESTTFIIHIIEQKDRMNLIKISYSQIMMRNLTYDLVK